MGRSRRSGLTGRAAILLVVVAALIVSYASSLRAWSDQRDRIAELRAEVEQAERKVDELGRTLERWEDPAYVEAQARERFGWVRPGETGYIVVDGEPKSTEPGVAADRGGSSDPWWQTLWGSVETSGVPPEPEEPGPTPIRSIDPEGKGTDSKSGPGGGDAGDGGDGGDGESGDGSG